MMHTYISYIRGLMPNLIKKSWTVSTLEISTNIREFIREFKVNVHLKLWGIPEQLLYNGTLGTRTRW